MVTVPLPRCRSLLLAVGISIMEARNVRFAFLAPNLTCRQKTVRCTRLIRSDAMYRCDHTTRAETNSIGRKYRSIPWYQLWREVRQIDTWLGCCTSGDLIFLRRLGTNPVRAGELFSNRPALCRRPIPRYYGHTFVKSRILVRRRLLRKDFRKDVRQIEGCLETRLARDPERGTAP